MQNLYETLLIVTPEADDDTVAAVIGDLRVVVENDGGKVLQAGVWQRRKLAYAVQGKTEGIYVLMYADGNNTLPAALKDRMRLDEAVIRSLVVRVEDKQEADVRQQIAEAETADQEQIEAQRKAAERRHEAEQAAAAMSLEEQVAAEEAEGVEEADEGEPEAEGAAEDAGPEDAGPEDAGPEETGPKVPVDEEVAGGIGEGAIPDVEPVVEPVPEPEEDTDAAAPAEDGGAEAPDEADASADDTETEDKES